MPPFTVSPPVPSAVFEPTVSVPSLSVVPPLYVTKKSRINMKNSHLRPFFVQNSHTKTDM
nr:hypothetical protein [Paraburkholderia bannensis]